MTRAQSPVIPLVAKKQVFQGELTAVSRFLTPKTISSHFAKRAQAFPFSTIQDLARILRRPCPTEATIIEQFKQFDQVEDNLWPPYGGRKAPLRITPGRLRSPEILFSCTKPHKRRKLELGFTTATTMQQRSSYSISAANSNVGFVNARTHLLKSERMPSVATDGKSPRIDCNLPKRAAAAEARGQADRPKPKTSDRQGEYS